MRCSAPVVHPLKACVLLAMTSDRNTRFLRRNLVFLLRLIVVQYGWLAESSI